MVVNDELRKKYIPTIGIEAHVQLKTKTKLFSAVGNDARNAKPNTLISHIDTGMPGALPVLNEKAIELAVKVAFALNTSPQKFSKFERKHYFYPDLPKGYQITQLENPFIIGGYVEFSVDGQRKLVNINRVQLEEDAGKNIHPEGADYSLVDLNRAGTPLLEIVSEPEIKSAAEAKAYTRELYLVMKYTGASDVDLYHGNMRFDVNISVSNESDKLGKRAEIKNLNSFRIVENAVAYEIDRQIELYETGKEVIQETRGWDEAKQKTISQRGKEEAHDYRYMPEPDIPPLELDDSLTNSVKNTMPILPKQLRDELSKTSLSESSIEVLISDPISAMFVYRTISKHGAEHAERIANWIVNSYVELISDPDAITEEHPVDDESAVLLSKMVSSNEVSASAAKTIWITMIREGGKPDKIADKLNLLQVSDENEIEKIVADVLEQNPHAAEDVKNGEMKAVGFLVGQVMAKSQGKANPQLAQEIIKKHLRL
jgi:aspartyl-tRNA(Asn)/glutamyl-tRNA(Gln) amidotransferase subunit B